MPTLSGAPDLSDFLALGAELEAAGHPHPAFSRAAEVRTAMYSAIRPEAYSPEGLDLVAADIADTADRLRQYTANIENLERARRAAETFETALFISARRALASASDDLIGDLRKEFDPAMRVIISAASRGITTKTTPGELIEAGDAKTIGVFNQLPAAVATLDRIGRIRIDLARIGGVGPAEHPIASLVAGVNSLEILKGAADLYAGVSRLVDVPGPFGTNRGYRTVHRVGGAWLDIHLAGITIHLNTATEAQTVVDSAIAEDLEPVSA